MFWWCIQLTECLSTSHTKYRLLNYLQLSLNNKQEIFTPAHTLLHLLFCYMSSPHCSKPMQKNLLRPNLTHCSWLPFFKRKLLYSLLPMSIKWFTLLYTVTFLWPSQNRIYFFLCVYFLRNTVTQLFHIHFETYIYMYTYGQTRVILISLWTQFSNCRSWIVVTRSAWWKLYKDQVGTKEQINCRH